MPDIFISYRREDTSGYAGRLYDQVSAHFGDDHVFMDVADLEPGSDFVETIEKKVSTCDALIALIGKNWLTIKDEQNQVPKRNRGASSGAPGKMRSPWVEAFGLRGSNLLRSESMKRCRLSLRVTLGGSS